MASFFQYFYFFISDIVASAILYIISVQMVQRHQFHMFREIMYEGSHNMYTRNTVHL